MAKPHDHLFQAVFSDPQHAGPLLKSALPQALAHAIDWSTLERRNTTQRGRRKRTTVCDVLFAARLRGGSELLLYVVLEHKSQSKRFDALQLLEQVLGVLRTHRREHPGEQFLPPVLPVVVHADQQPWNSPRNVSELFDLDALPPDLRNLVPSFNYLLDDLHAKPPEHLRRRALTVFGLCAMSMLQYLPPAARDPEALARFFDMWGDVQDRAARLADAGSADDIYELVVDYLLETSNLPSAIVHRTMRDRLTEDAMKKFVSTRTQIRNEGIAIGKAEGESAGRTRILLRQLERRFGPLDAATLERVRSGTSDDLDQWADRLLDAPTLAAVFAKET